MIIENCERLHKEIIRRCHEELYYNRQKEFKLKRMRSALRPKAKSPFGIIKKEIEEIEKQLRELDNG
mgnify:CR=1 FL=1